MAQISRKDVIEWAKLETDIADQLIRLYELTANIPHKDKVVVELGTRRGNSTRALLAAVNDSGGHLYSVDIGKCWRAVSALHEEPNWTFTRGDDLEVVKQWNLPISLISVHRIQRKQRVGSHQENSITMTEIKGEPPKNPYMEQYTMIGE